MTTPMQFAESPLPSSTSASVGSYLFFDDFFVFFDDFFVFDDFLFWTTFCF